jgi:putative hydrolase of the HAD superfamily
MLRAVTFDFWDTLVVDDSDEPARARLGLPPKAEARRALFHSAATRSLHHGAGTPAQLARAASDPAWWTASVDAAWEAANANFRRQWLELRFTPHIRDRLADAFARLGLQPAPTAVFTDLVDAIAGMEVEHPPVLVPGVAEGLRALHGRYRLGIISDTIVTPGSGLRKILAHYNLLDLFSAMIFSDEVGACKPSPAVFEAAAAALGCAPSELAHVGDREKNDVDGPLGVGAVAVLYTGAVDRGSATTRAQLVCADHRQLAGLLAGLESA